MPASPLTHAAPDRPARRRRRRIARLILLLMLLLIPAAVVGMGAGAPPDDDPSSAVAVDRSRGERAGSSDEEELEAAEGPVAARDDVEVSSGDPDAGDPGPVDFDPVGDGDGADPCADLPAEQGSLLVVPDPLVLPSGDLEDQLHIRNCGPGQVPWTAATKPTVTLATAGGTLAPGQVTALGFTIQKSAWGPGAIDFKIKVSEPGHNVYVDVHAFRPLVGADVVATNEISAGPGVGGCAQQCITKALISRAMTTPDVALDVATTVPAKVRVYLSTHAPVDDPDGNPMFPGAAPTASSPAGVETWKTPLSNLAAGTKYFIIVRATDADDETAFRSGSFRTNTPFEPGGGLAGGDPEGGCANQCIAKATVTPGPSLTPATVSVKTHTPAQLQLMLSTDAPTWSAGVPSFAKKDVWHASGLDYIDRWESVVNGLEPATTYHGIVVARDANGQQSYAVGQLTTDGVDLVMTVHEVHLTKDGDEGLDSNRGEVRFSWGVGEAVAGARGEEKLHDGAVVHFGRSQSDYVVRDAKGLIPTVRVAAAERDADGLTEWCSEGDGLVEEPFYSGGCDRKWNVASSPDVRVGELHRLEECAAFGIDDDVYADRPCLRLVSEDASDDYPHYWAIVSFAMVE